MILVRNLWAKVENKHEAFKENPKFHQSKNTSSAQVGVELLT